MCGIMDVDKLGFDDVIWITRNLGKILLIKKLRPNTPANPFFWIYHR